MNNEFMSGDNDFWQEPDFLLADLVSGLVNKGGMELGVTLFVKGLVITGTLVSEQGYLQAISSMFATQAKKSMRNPTRQDLEETEAAFDFTGLAEDVDITDLYGEREEFDDDSSQEPFDDELNARHTDTSEFDGLDEFESFEEMEERKYPAIRYLHLKDPSIIQPQPAVSFTHSQVPVLRIRLTAVDGWMVGRVTIESPIPGMDEYDDLDNMDDFPPIGSNLRH
jgi:hypothetical protein